MMHSYVHMNHWNVRPQYGISNDGPHIFLQQSRGRRSTLRAHEGVTSDALVHEAFRDAKRLL